MLSVVVRPDALNGSSIRRFSFRVPAHLLDRLAGVHRVGSSPHAHQTSDLKISTVSSDSFHRTFNTITSFAFDKEQQEEEFISTDASVASRRKRFCFRNDPDKIRELVMRHTATSFRMKRPRGFCFTVKGAALSFLTV